MADGISLAWGYSAILRLPTVDVPGDASDVLLGGLLYRMASLGDVLTAIDDDGGFVKAIPRGVY